MVGRRESARPRRQRGASLRRGRGPRSRHRAAGEGPERRRDPHPPDAVRPRPRSRFAFVQVAKPRQRWRACAGRCDATASRAPAASAATCRPHRQVGQSPFLRGPASRTTSPPIAAGPSCSLSLRERRAVTSPAGGSTRSGSAERAHRGGRWRLRSFSQLTPGQRSVGFTVQLVGYRRLRDGLRSCGCASTDDSAPAHGRAATALPRGRLRRRRRDRDPRRPYRGGTSRAVPAPRQRGASVGR